MKKIKLKFVMISQSIFKATKILAILFIVNIFILSVNKVQAVQGLKCGSIIGSCSGGSATDVLPDIHGCKTWSCVGGNGTAEDCSVCAQIGGGIIGGNGITGGKGITGGGGTTGGGNITSPIALPSCGKDSDCVEFCRNWNYGRDSSCTAEAHPELSKSVMTWEEWNASYGYWGMGCTNFISHPIPKCCGKPQYNTDYGALYGGKCQCPVTGECQVMPDGTSMWPGSEQWGKNTTDFPLPGFCPDKQLCEEYIENGVKKARCVNPSQCYKTADCPKDKSKCELEIREASDGSGKLIEAWSKVTQAYACECGKCIPSAIGSIHENCPDDMGCEDMPEGAVCSCINGGWSKDWYPKDSKKPWQKIGSCDMNTCKQEYGQDQVKLCNNPAPSKDCGKPCPEKESHENLIIMKMACDAKDVKYGVWVKVGENEVESSVCGETVPCKLDSTITTTYRCDLKCGAKECENASRWKTEVKKGVTYAYAVQVYSNKECQLTGLCTDKPGGDTTKWVTDTSYAKKCTVIKDLNDPQGVKGLMQWTSYSTVYNKPKSDDPCRYECVEHYVETDDGNGNITCEPESIDADCDDLPGICSSWIGENKYKKYWDGTKFSPEYSLHHWTANTDFTGEGEVSDEDAICAFICNYNTTWDENKQECVPDEKRVYCDGVDLISKNRDKYVFNDGKLKGEWGKFKQIYNCTDKTWLPKNRTVQYGEDVADCNYKCNEDNCYFWSPTANDCMPQIYPPIKCARPQVDANEAIVWEGDDYYVPGVDKTIKKPGEKPSCEAILCATTYYDPNIKACGCTYKCAENYIWDDVQKKCIHEKEVDCVGTLPKNTQINTATKIKQTYHTMPRPGSWTPDNTYTPNDTPSTTECYYKCKDADDDYTYEWEDDRTLGCKAIGKEKKCQPEDFYNKNNGKCEYEFGANIYMTPPTIKGDWEENKVLDVCKWHCIDNYINNNGVCEPITEEVECKGKEILLIEDNRMPAEKMYELNNKDTFSRTATCTGWDQDLTMVYSEKTGDCKYKCNKCNGYIPNDTNDGCKLDSCLDGTCTLPNVKKTDSIELVSANFPRSLAKSATGCYDTCNPLEEEMEAVHEDNAKANNPCKFKCAAGYSYNEEYTTDKTKEPCIILNACDGKESVEYTGSVCNDDNGTCVYPIIAIGDQCWFQKNVNIGKLVDITERQGDPKVQIQKYCRDNDSTKCASLGAYYNWHTMMMLPENCDDEFCNTGDGIVQGICPLGWHVPNDKDWSELNNYVGSNGAGDKIKDVAYCTNGNECNSSEFTEKLNGYVDNRIGKFWPADGKHTAGFQFSSTEFNNNGLVSFTAWPTYIKAADLNSFVFSKSDYSDSLRCIKDKVPKPQAKCSVSISFSPVDAPSNLIAYRIFSKIGAFKVIPNGDNIDFRGFIFYITRADGTTPEGTAVKSLTIDGVSRPVLFDSKNNNYVVNFDNFYYQIPKTGATFQVEGNFNEIGNNPLPTSGQDFRVVLKGYTCSIGAGNEVKYDNLNIPFNPNVLAINKPSIWSSYLPNNILRIGEQDVLGFTVGTFDRVDPINVKGFSIMPKLSGLIGPTTVSKVFDVADPGTNLLKAPVILTSGKKQYLEFKNDILIIPMTYRQFIIKINVSDLTPYSSLLQVNLYNSDIINTEPIDWKWNDTTKPINEYNGDYLGGYLLEDTKIFGPLLKNY